MHTEVTGFRVEEVLDIAHEIEQHEAEFYRKAACETKDQRISQLLLDLAMMEDAHQHTFDDMKHGLLRKEWIPAFDLGGLSVTYLRAIAAGRIFDAKANLADSLTGSDSAESILRTAIAFEKDALIFYQELRQIVPERMGKSRIEKIVGEEIRHIAELNSGLANLK